MALPVFWRLKQGLLELATCSQYDEPDGCFILCRQGIDCQGFHADTMHMARLWNSSRTMGKGYSLEVCAMALPCLDNEWDWDAPVT